MSVFASEHLLAATAAIMKNAAETPESVSTLGLLLFVAICVACLAFFSVAFAADTDIPIDEKAELYSAGMGESLLAAGLDCQADETFNDDFESYTTGDLIGQGGWTNDTNGTDFDVVTTDSPSTGTKHVVNNGNGEHRVYKDFTGADCGGFVFYLRADAFQANTDAWIVSIMNGATQIARVMLYRHSTDGLTARGEIFPNAQGVFATGLTYGVYYKFEIDWDASTEEVAISFEDGDFVIETATAFTEVNRFRVYLTTDAGTNQLYIDDISDANPAATPTPSPTIWPVWASLSSSDVADSFAVIAGSFLLVVFLLSVFLAFYVLRR